MEATKTNKPVGRPRKFDKGMALEKALDVFRRKGYEATSLSDITDALDINRPSLYSAFGNKESLFVQALDKYMSGPLAYMFEVLNEKTSREVVQQMLSKSADLLTFFENSNACLAIKSSMSSELEAAGIQKKIVTAILHHEQKLIERFDQAVLDKDLPSHTDTMRLAKYVTTLHKGMSIQASYGISKMELLGIVDVVMESWPGK